MTTQINDHLIFNSKEYRIDILGENLLEMMEIKPYKYYSHCMKGYVAYYEVIDSEIILVDINLGKKEMQENKEETLIKFYDKYKNGKINWLNRILVLEEEKNDFIVLEIKNGTVIYTIYCNKEKFETLIDDQFEKHKNTGEYKEEIKNVINSYPKDDSVMPISEYLKSYNEVNRNTILYQITSLYK